MKMIAIGTVHGRKLVRAADPKNPKSRAKYTDLIAAPGTEFDTDDFGVDDEEAQQLIASGAARRKTREVVDDADGDGFERLSDGELIARAEKAGITLKQGMSRDDVLAELRKAAR